MALRHLGQLGDRDHVALGEGPADDFVALVADLAESPLDLLQAGIDRRQLLGLLRAQAAEDPLDGGAGGADVVACPGGVGRAAVSGAAVVG